jgi:hypothetical protein
MIRLLLAGLLAISALSLVPASTVANPLPGVPQRCQSLAQTNVEIDAAVAKVGGARETLAGKSAQDYLDVVNAAPPASDIHSDLVVLFERDSDTVIGARLADDKICIVARVGSKIHDRAIKAARGTGA